MTSKFTPSTALISPTSRERMIPLTTGKYFLSPLTDSKASVMTLLHLGLPCSIEMATHQMSIRHRLQLRLALSTDRHGMFAAWVKPTPAWGVDQVRHHPFDRFQWFPGAIHHGVTVQ